MNVKKLDMLASRSVYTADATTGAYIGFGSLLYQTMLIELKKHDASALLMSDRNHLSDDAKSIYQKMMECDDMIKIKVPVGSPLFERNGRSSFKEDSYLDCAYAIRATPEMLFVHNKMLSNHQERKIDIDIQNNIDEMIECLGEWVDLNKSHLEQEMLNGYPELIEHGAVVIRELDGDECSLQPPVSRKKPRSAELLCVLFAIACE